MPGLLTGEQDDSGSVQLTLRSDLQQVARDALGEREGSVVVLEPKTGAVKAMWSFPGYDPNLIADPDFEQARAVLAFYENFPGDPLLANTYQQRYMPGSTFKLLTTGIALQNGVVNLETEFPDESEFLPPQTTDPIENFEGTTCGGDLTEVFARSCNIAFARIALDIGVERMLDGVAAWGVGEPIPIDLPRPAASTFGNSTDLDQQLPLLAIRGFGQNEVQMVPMHMAMVAATIANGGQMMKPYVVDAELDHNGALLDRTRAGGVEDTDLARGGADPQRPHAGGRHGGHGQLLHRPRQRHLGRRQDRHGAAQRPGEPERSHAWIVAFAPGRGPPIRRRRDAARARTTRSPPARAVAWPARSPRPSSTPPSPEAAERGRARPHFANAATGGAAAQRARQAESLAARSMDSLPRRSAPRCGRMRQ